ncbi:hypothetical protein EV702DRAFT_521071 [Suillus placidus]|uniref:Uncharacterized protein n=1 Tax=Suillus placidus TaxID=48579 RepID=A0A9P7D062_9AGAM|nr:hypothetical protein EV702DRAFT_521071 [Suillus placidus]
MVPRLCPTLSLCVHVLLSVCVLSRLSSFLADADGATTMFRSQEEEFLRRARDTLPMSSRPGHLPHSHAYDRYSGIKEIEEDSDQDEEGDGMEEDSDDAPLLGARCFKSSALRSSQYM